MVIITTPKLFHHETAKTIYTANGAFKEGDTSWKQCRNEKISEKRAQSMFDRIDKDGNGELSWEEICDRRDRECKKHKWAKPVVFITTLMRSFSLKKSVRACSDFGEEICTIQNETDRYRNKKKNMTIQ